MNIDIQYKSLYMYPINKFSVIVISLFITARLALRGLKAQCIIAHLAQSAIVENTFKVFLVFKYRA